MSGVLIGAVSLGLVFGRGRVLNVVPCSLKNGEHGGFGCGWSLVLDGGQDGLML